MAARKYTPTISIIGRPNVDKSSIFNRLMKKCTKALTFDIPGVTRDRHYGIVPFEDRCGENPLDVILVDTGGFYPQKVEDLGPSKESSFFNIMASHAKIAIEESDLVLFVVDIREGLLPMDKSITDFIRSTKKEFWILINKYDSEKQLGEESEFYALGVPEERMLSVSAAHGLGFGTLKERIYQQLSQLESEMGPGLDLQLGVTPHYPVVANLALIGAPNAGKSTLLNCLIGAKRALVSHIPGTTVDPIIGYFDIDFGQRGESLKEQQDAWRVSNRDLLSDYNEWEKFVETSGESIVGEFDHSGLCRYSNAESEQQEKSAGPTLRSLKIVDTAGIRRKHNVSGYIETQSVYRSLRCITDSDIVIFMVDAESGISHQDRRLCDIALEKGKSLILCLNKTDLIREKIKTPMDRKNWLSDLRYKIPWLDYCEIVTISAKYKKNIIGLKRAVKKTVLVRNKKITTSALNKCVMDLVANHTVVLKGSRGKPFKVKYASMLKANPPTFLLFSNKSQAIPDNFRRYLQKGIRRNFDLVNTPVHLIFRTNTELEKRVGKLPR